MKLTICRLDASLFLNEKNIKWIVQALTSFKKDVTETDLATARLGQSAAFAYYARAQYDKCDDANNFSFDKSFIFPDKRSSVKGVGNRNTLSSWCRIMGFLYDDEDNFDIGEFAKELIATGKLSIPEICFAILAKQWVVVENLCERNLLSVIHELVEADDSTFLQDLGDYTSTKKQLQDSLQNQFFKAVTGRECTSADDIQFARFDALRSTLVESGLFSFTEDRKLSVTAEGRMILEDFYNHEGRLTKFNPRKVEKKEIYLHQYMCAIENGVFDIISDDNASIYDSLYPNIVKISRNLVASEVKPVAEIKLPYQVIRYGAPGSGKSFNTDKVIKESLNSVFSGKFDKNYIRTTFHPDTDYSSFVGSYKPSSSLKNVYGLDADGNTKSLMDLATDNQLREVQVEYKFVKQAFIKSYIQAWKSFKESYKNDEKLIPQFLVIEEINRGNCAQIFGDIFQLLDRKLGFSEYPIIADEDIRKCLIAEETEDDPSFGEYGLQLSLRQRAAINRI